MVLLNIGKSDIQFDQRMKDEEWENDLNIILDYLNEGNFDHDAIKFPILESINKLLVSKEDVPETVVMFYTEQKDKAFSKSDTNVAFEILKKCVENGFVFDGCQPKVIGYSIQEAPFSYDVMLYDYRNMIESLMVNLQNLKSNVYISLTGGTPACNFALLHAIHGRKELRDLRRFIYSPRPGKGAPQPPAEEINVDTYLSGKEILNTIDELVTKQHYGQAKTLFNNLRLLGNHREAISIFMDSLLLRRNQLYQRAIEKLNLIPKQSLLSEQPYVSEMWSQIQRLAQGYKNAITYKKELLRSREVKDLYVEHYWNLERLFNLEQYNEWITGLITYHDNLLKLKTLKVLKETFDEDQLSNSVLKKAMGHVEAKKGFSVFGNEDFYCGRNRYPHRKTYQLFIKVLDSDSDLGENSDWVKSVESLNQTRNDIIHSFGGLQKSDIEDSFKNNDWRKALRRILMTEFNIHIKDNPLENIHNAFISWIHRL